MVAEAGFLFPALPPTTDQGASRPPWWYWGGHPHAVHAAAGSRFASVSFSWGKGDGE